MGCAVGEYIGDGKGESDSAPEIQAVGVENMEADLTVDQSLEGEEDSTDNAHPLFIFYDCETTGLSIYNNHITDIAAKVVTSVPLTDPTFSSLVKTSRRIPAAGIVLTQPFVYNM